METQLPVIFIVGPTASGKTALSISLAEKCDGEIICADSRTVYRRMDIGTAKPSKEERARVPHWGLDLVEPGDRFTAADFKRYADAKIAEIRARHHVPFVVGGSGLYMSSVLYNFQFDHSYDEKLRQKLASYTIEQLHEYCIKNNVMIPENNKNKRYLIRAIEKNRVHRESAHQPMEHSIVVGITPRSKADLEQRIRTRAEQLFENGVVEEAIMLGDMYGWDSEAMTGNVYSLVHGYVEGGMSLTDLKERFIVSDRQLAKKQMTWFRRDSTIRWLSLAEAEVYLTEVLSEH